MLLLEKSGLLSACALLLFLRVAALRDLILQQTLKAPWGMLSPRVAPCGDDGASGGKRRWKRGRRDHSHSAPLTAPQNGQESLSTPRAVRASPHRCRLLGLWAAPTPHRDPTHWLGASNLGRCSSSACVSNAHAILSANQTSCPTSQRRPSLLTCRPLWTAARTRFSHSKTHLPSNDRDRYCREPSLIGVGDDPLHRVAYFTVQLCVRWRYAILNT